MDHEQFTNVFDSQVKRSRDILIEKAKQYATDTDRLANFKAAAALQGISPQAALAGMMAKHSYSVYAMAHSTEEFTLEQWDEKITDHVNYLILLRAVLEEQWSDVNAEAISNGLEQMRTNVSYRPYYEKRDFELFKLVLDTRQNAELVLEKIRELINKFTVATVADVYDLIGIASDFRHNHFGWNNAADMHIERTREGFQLKLPDPQFIR